MKRTASRTVRRYYVSSLAPEAETLLEAARRHGHIENKMRWILGVAFQENQNRIRAGHAAQNTAAVRRFALSLLKQDDSLSVGVKNKHLRAGWDHDCLQAVLQQARCDCPGWSFSKKAAKQPLHVNFDGSLRATMPRTSTARPDNRESC